MNLTQMRGRRWAALETPLLRSHGMEPRTETSAHTPSTPSGGQVRSGESLAVQRPGETCLDHALGISLRSYREPDCSATHNLLADIDVLYPGGHDWLTRRLTDVLDGRAECVLLAERLNHVSADHLVGAAILSPKDGLSPRLSNRVKISTFIIAPSHRGRGLATRFIADLAVTWRTQGTRVHLTCPAPQAEAFYGVLKKAGFRWMAVERDRYGRGRDEAVFVRAAARPAR